MVLYEIEQKFALNAATLSRFRLNHGSPPFRTLTRLKATSFHDEYFDLGGKLLKQGLYIRKRGNTWEAKVRHGKQDFIRSTFYETCNVDEIKQLVRKHANLADATREDFGLKSICRYRTDRETYLADNEFSIMLDSTDFGHHVGEVELQTSDNVKALARIDAFMQRYGWLFHIGAEVKGKMTAFFDKFGYPAEHE